MVSRLLLASRSPVRLKLLQQAGVDAEAFPARIDEDAIRQSLVAEATRPRDIADALAEAKAIKIASRETGALVLGCDQILAIDGEILTKPETPEQARLQLTRLRGNTHILHSAAVLARDGQTVWRHIGEARLTMRPFSDSYLVGYLQRNWPRVSGSVGSYRLEEEGVRLFSRIDGSYFTVLGLPLIELLNHLVTTKAIEA